MHEHLPPDRDGAQAMKASLRLAPPDSAHTRAEEPMYEVEFMPPAVDQRQLGLSPYSGFLVYCFAEGTAVHSGMRQAIASGLRSRFPLVAIDDRELHVQFALEDDGEGSRERVGAVARKIQELLPNGRMDQVSIECAPYDGPTRAARLAAVDDLALGSQE